MSDIKNLDLLFPKLDIISTSSTNRSLSNDTVAGSSFADILKSAFNNVDATTSLADGSVEDLNFTDIVKSAVGDVNILQHAAKDSTMQALSGDPVDIADTMIALQKADASLKMMLEVRNKILAAYQEVIKTQI